MLGISGVGFSGGAALAWIFSGTDVLLVNEFYLCLAAPAMALTGHL